MTAGLNLKLDFYNMNTPAGSDDVIGGAMVTGTNYFQGAEGRIEPIKPSTILIQQGYEIVELFMCVVRPVNLQIFENDDAVVTYPTTHFLYNTRMRITSIQRPSVHPDDSRGYLILTLRRRQYAHNNKV